jgi:site-specific recombinase XerD
LFKPTIRVYIWPQIIRMPNTTFVLKQPNGSEETLIYLIFRFNTQKLKYSTGQKIAPKFWNETKHRAKESRSFPNALELNSLLDRLESIISNEYRILLNDGKEPNFANLRLALDKFLQKNKVALKLNLIDFAEELVTNSNRKAGTKTQLYQTIKILADYQARINRTLTFECIDLDFYDRFVGFLMERQYKTNTIGKVIKNVKVFMNEAVSRGLTSNVQFKNKKFKKTVEHSESIYLSISEINRLYEYDLSENLRLDKVRDLFVIGCYTGLRFSDLVKLKEENFLDSQTKLKVMTEKTGELVIIPLHPFVRQILKKYGGVPPTLISNNKMNQYLKELGELVGINEQVLISGTKGGVKQSEIYRKFELITVHTARRSFATNAYINPVPSISIMKITGHRTEKAFLTYIKITQEDNANKLLSHPFFTNTSRTNTHIKDFREVA